MLPRLQRFYGAPAGRRFNLRTCRFEDSADWLDVQPVKFKAFVTMLPRLQAEEQLQGLSLAFASEGRMLKDADQQRLLSQLEARAAGVETQRQKATPAQMELFGVKVKMHRTQKGGARPPKRPVRQAEPV